MTTKKAELPQRSFSGDDARRLFRKARTGSLATLNRDDGGPYVSLINLATDVEGWPIIFISRLAWHTQNLLADGRASIQVAALPAEGDALTGARVTVMGHAEQIEGAVPRRRYLARHPEAVSYIGFADFSFWRLKPQRIHAVAGFGRIETMGAEEVFPAAPDWPELEASAIAHMNADHGDAIQRYGQHVTGSTERGWLVAAIDPDGCDLVCGQHLARLEFKTPARNSGELRLAFKRISEDLM